MNTYFHCFYRNMLLLETPEAIRFLLVSSAIFITAWGRWRAPREVLFLVEMPVWMGGSHLRGNDCTLDILREFILPLIKSTARFTTEEKVVMEKK